MLRHVYIIKSNKVIYEKIFAKSITNEVFSTLFEEIKKDSLLLSGKTINSFNLLRNRVVYINEKNLDLFIIFITGLTDDAFRIEAELKKFKKEFLNLFGDMLDDSLDPSIVELVGLNIDRIHRNLKPKISLIGFSGVGKTTITKLIRAEEIPMEHIPTITGDVTTIQIGKLQFNLWDFAGQEMFSYIWSNFIKGSDAVLLITDSTLENVEKSKFFLELIKSDAPDAQAAVIGNKQDAEGALPVEKIEQILGLKTYSMIAIEPGNRDKMIQIIADVLEMNPEVSSLLKPLFERDHLVSDVQRSLEEGNFDEAVRHFERLYEICLEVGDNSLALEFYEKGEKLKALLKN